LFKNKHGGRRYGENINPSPPHSIYEVGKTCPLWASEVGTNGAGLNFHPNFTQNRSLILNQSRVSWEWLKHNQESIKNF